MIKGINAIKDKDWEDFKKELMLFKMSDTVTKKEKAKIIFKYNLLPKDRTNIMYIEFKEIVLDRDAE